jgi:hypothetical protein
VQLDRSFWIIFVAAIAIRCVALGHPLLDAHLLRQCQTAAATKSLMEEPGFHLSAKIPWLGDIDAHYVQEFPLYNYLVIGANALLHDVDLSGKATSILLWAASFVCLQFIWRRILRGEETFWANLLFVLAPLNIFYGQAFMPEMLIQFLAFAFILSILCYRENPSLGRWTMCTSAGLLALLVKLPETAHLYLIFGLVLIRDEGWRAAIRPRYLIAAAGTIIAVKLWGNFMDNVNRVYLPEWTSISNLRGFIGPLTMRLDFSRWLMIFLYLSAFVFAGLPLLGAAYGLSIFARECNRGLFGLWLLSLAAFYLLWFGNGPTMQSYYNLPSVGPGCALFGIGVAALLKTRHPALATLCTIVLLLSTAPVCYYLFRQDRQLLGAATWTRLNTQPNDIILFRPNHRWDLADYPYDAVLAYYADRRTFVWTRYMGEPIRERALQRSRYAVVTLPESGVAEPISDLLARVRGRMWQPEPLDWIKQTGFTLRTDEPAFRVYERAAQ